MKSDYLVDVLEKTPSRIFVWGNTALFLFLILLVLLAHIVRYPDTLQGEVLIRTLNPPVEMLAEFTEQIHHIFVKDGDEVSRDDAILQMHAATDLHTVQKLESIATGLSKVSNMNDYSNFSFPDNLKSGELSSEYLNLNDALAAVKDLIAQSGVFRRIASLEQEISLTLEMLGHARSEALLISAEHKLMERDFSRSSDLFSSGSISASELERSELQLLAMKRRSNETAIKEKEYLITIEKHNRKIIELSAMRNENEDFLKSSLKSKIEEMVQGIKSWREKYVISAPISGTVTYNHGFLIEKKFVQKGQELFSILPNAEDESIIAQGYLSSTRIGELDLEDRVLIRLKAYPFQVHGVLEGNVSLISTIPSSSLNADKYAIQITLPDRLETSYGRDIATTQNMQGTAFYLTNSRSLLQRMVDPLKNLSLNN